ncbi:MAG TPA: thiamine-phosphate kinase [Opitutaceae bacterium]|nr:thiamine-phosphate kinase [Opitutaceae bacterium]
MHPYSNNRRATVAALGEEKLIAAIRRWLGKVSPRSPFGIGDDCAVVPGSGRSQLVTVDPVIFGRHFDATVPPRAVGAKLLKRNLSDIAAMGGEPRVAVVALTLDARTRIDWVEGFYRGLADVARRYRISVVGGDVAQADGTVAASLTLLGETTGSRAVTRTGARSGDWIYVTGRLGNTVRTGHHYRFTPRLEEGAWLARQRDVRAMMDVSDGLAKDLHALTPRAATPALEPASLPLRAGADIRAALSDGEDYELVFAFARQGDRAALERAWHRRFPRLPLSCIGRFLPPNALPAGTLNLQDFRGYEHLR